MSEPTDRAIVGIGAILTPAAIDRSLGVLERQPAALAAIGAGTRAGGTARDRQVDGRFDGRFNAADRVPYLIVRGYRTVGLEPGSPGA